VKELPSVKQRITELMNELRGAIEDIVEQAEQQPSLNKEEAYICMRAMEIADKTRYSASPDTHKAEKVLIAKLKKIAGVE